MRNLRLRGKKATELVMETGSDHTKAGLGTVTPSVQILKKYERTIKLPSRSLLCNSQIEHLLKTKSFRFENLI